MTLKRAFTLFLCLSMAVFIFLGPELLQRYKVDYNNGYENMKREIPWRGVITVWDYPRLNNSNGTKLSWISNKIRQFEKRHPGVYIDFKELDTTSGLTLLKAAAVTGAPPDIAPVGSDYFFLSEGLLEELDPYISAEEKEDFLPKTLESASYNAKLYGLPWMMTGYILLVNTQLFAEKGIPVPQEGNWSYEQFLEAAKQLTFGSNKRKGPEIYGFNCAIQTGNYSMYPFIEGDGARILNEISGDYSFEGAPALTGLQKLWQLKNTHKVTPDNFGSATQGEIQASFINGKTAIIPAGSWAIPYLRNVSSNTMEFTTVNYPVGSSTVSNATVCSFGVFKQEDKNKRRMCVEFIKFITAAEGQEELTKYGYLPVRISGQNLYQNDKEMSMVQQNVNTASLLPRHKNWEQIDIILQSRIKAAMLGELTPEQAIAEAKQLLQKYTK
jgi:multiple sugar transport system substrate-binding protein